MSASPPQPKAQTDQEILDDMLFGPPPPTEIEEISSRAAELADFDAPPVVAIPRDFAWRYSSKSPAQPKTLRQAVSRACGPAVSTIEVLRKMPEAQRNAWVDAHPLDALRLERAFEKRERRAKR